MRMACFWPVHLATLGWLFVIDLYNSAAAIMNFCGITIRYST
ncbi:putative membrane protein [Burkholderia pseudomallei MSHR7498]|nr:putative membrane protein [Burkholderia pseudomallei MSHR7498]